MVHAQLEDSRWIRFYRSSVRAFVAFGFSWGNACNDLANGFATSVGSRTLTLNQAVLIAIVFDFAGAMLLGRVAMATIANGVADINNFSANPEVYAYGMICACTTGTFWLAVAPRMGVNVSGNYFIRGKLLFYIPTMKSSSLSQGGATCVSIICDILPMSTPTSAPRPRHPVLRQYCKTTADSRQAIADSVLIQLSPEAWGAFNASQVATANSIKATADPTKAGTMRPKVYLGDLQRALALMEQNTILTFGQNNDFNSLELCNSNITSHIQNKTMAVCRPPNLVPLTFT